MGNLLIDSCLYFGFFKFQHLKKNMSFGKKLSCDSVPLLPYICTPASRGARTVQFEVDPLVEQSAVRTF